jgi:hypothetical protein
MRAIAPAIAPCCTAHALCSSGRALGAHYSIWHALHLARCQIHASNTSSSRLTSSPKRVRRLSQNSIAPASTDSPGCSGARMAERRELPSAPCRRTTWSVRSPPSCDSSRVRQSQYPSGEIGGESGSAGWSEQDGREGGERDGVGERQPSRQARTFFTNAARLISASLMWHSKVLSSFETVARPLAFSRRAVRRWHEQHEWTDMSNSVGEMGHPHFSCREFESRLRLHSKAPIASRIAPLPCTTNLQGPKNSRSLRKWETVTISGVGERGWCRCKRMVGAWLGSIKALPVASDMSNVKLCRAHAALIGFQQGARARRSGGSALRALGTNQPKTLWT